MFGFREQSESAVMHQECVINFFILHVFILVSLDQYKRKRDIYESHKVVTIQQTPVNPTSALLEHWLGSSPQLNPFLLLRQKYSPKYAFMLFLSLGVHFFKECIVQFHSFLSFIKMKSDSCLATQCHVLVFAHADILLQSISVSVISAFLLCDCLHSAIQNYSIWLESGYPKGGCRKHFSVTLQMPMLWDSESRVAGSGITCFLNLARWCQVVFQSGFAYFHSQQQCVRFCCSAS